MDTKRQKRQLALTAGSAVKRAVAALATAAITRLGGEASPAAELACNTYLLRDVANLLLDEAAHIAVFSGTRTEIYSIAEDAWRPGPHMDMSAPCAAMRAPDGRVYVLGGPASRGHIRGRMIAADGGELVKAVERTGWVIANIWKEMPVLSGMRTRFGAGIVDSRIFVFGGSWVDAGEYYPPLVGTCDVFDTATCLWQMEAANMPEPRADMVTAVVGHCIYAIGGSSPDGRRTCNTMMLDTTANAWTCMQPIPAGRTRPAVAVIDERFIWVMGGLTEHGVSASIDVFDTVTRRWSVPRTVMPVSRWSAKAVAVGGRIFVIGGADESVSNATGTVAVLDTVTLTWTAVCSMPRPCDDFVAIAL
jgi:hypothetical protein